jgi:nitroreductase
VGELFIPAGGELVVACKDTAMDINAAMFGRRSVREYTAQSVDPKIILSLIDAAVHAPNAVNQQPWTFTVVRDQSVLARISDNAKRHMLATTPPGPQADYFRPRLTDPNFHVFYHAPVVIIISAIEQGPWIVEDCALAAENLMLAAYAHGLGSCWIGFAQGYLNTPDGKRALDLPAAWVSVAPIIVGHPKAVAPAVPRKQPAIKWFD